MSDMNYSFNIGKIGNINNKNKDAEYNQAGAILFTKDTNELFINLNNITNDNEAETYRKQVNSLYSTAIIKYDENNKISGQIFNHSTLETMYENISDQATKLAGKMNMEHPTGNGIFNFGNDNTEEKNLEEEKRKKHNSIMLGYYLKQGENAQNSIINGKYNKPIKDALLTVGNGSGDNDQDRKNLFVVTPAYSYFKNLYIVDNDATGMPNSQDKVMTQKDGNQIIARINNLSPKPFNAQDIPPDDPSLGLSDEEKKKVRNLFWINTKKGKGNGVLNYWKPDSDGITGKWVEISAVFT